MFGYNCWIDGYILPYLYPNLHPRRGLSEPSDSHLLESEYACDSRVAASGMNYIIISAVGGTYCWLLIAAATEVVIFGYKIIG